MIPEPDFAEAIAQEIVRGDYLARVHIGLDYFIPVDWRLIKFFFNFVSHRQLVGINFWSMINHLCGYLDH